MPRLYHTLPYKPHQQKNNLSKQCANCEKWAGYQKNESYETLSKVAYDLFCSSAFSSGSSTLLPNIFQNLRMFFCSSPLALSSNIFYSPLSKISWWPFGFTSLFQQKSLYFNCNPSTIYGNLFEGFKPNYLQIFSNFELSGSGRWTEGIQRQRERKRETKILKDSTKTNAWYHIPVTLRVIRRGHGYCGLHLFTKLVDYVVVELASLIM